MRDYSLRIYKSVQINLQFLYSCVLGECVIELTGEDLRSFSAIDILFRQSLRPLFRIWLCGIGCKLVIEQKNSRAKNRLIERFKWEDEWFLIRTPEDELNYESFVSQDFLVMNGACKYARMHNKTAQRGSQPQVRPSCYLFYRNVCVA